MAEGSKGLSTGLRKNKGEHVRIPPLVFFAMSSPPCLQTLLLISWVILPQIDQNDIQYLLAIPHLEGLFPF